MKKVVIAVAVLLIASLVSVCLYLFPRLEGGSLEYYLSCQQAGGEWISQSSSCQDLCSAHAQGLACTLDYQYSCACGSDRCWDPAQKHCIENPAVVPQLQPACPSEDPGCLELGLE